MYDERFIYIYIYYIYLCWVSDLDIGFFLLSDQNDDNKLTEDEVLTNPNKAIVWKWSDELDKYPKMAKDLKGGHIDIKEYLNYYNTNTTGKYI